MQIWAKLPLILFKYLFFILVNPQKKGDLIIGDYVKHLKYKRFGKIYFAFCLINIKKVDLQPSNFIKIILDEEDVKYSDYFLAKNYKTNTTSHQVLVKNKRLISYIHPNLNYLPSFKQRYKSKWIFIRRNRDNDFVLMGRKKDDYCDTLRYRFFECFLISTLFYICGAIMTALTKRKVILFYEKFGKKASEGVVELMRDVQNQSNAKCYYILDECSEAWKPTLKRVQNKNFLVKKWSLKYYYLLYRSTVNIGTEAPLHLNLLHIVNTVLRFKLLATKFVFLQHGIIYMKNLGKKSIFRYGSEATPDLIVVSSQKEAEVVEKTLNLPLKRSIITGLIQYDSIEYNHINQNSENIITVMLTWKNWDQSLVDFNESSYFQTTFEIVEIINQINQVSKNKIGIQILAHPKVNDKLRESDLGSLMFDGEIKDALAKTKLLITDYSSICYNAFYQGAGVVFYQGDLERYENDMGPLIPEDSEYIGLRSFNISQLETILKKGISPESGEINLSHFRTSEHQKSFSKICEFHDGNNQQRVIEALKKHKYI